VLAVIVVILQGVLGGLRVVLFKDQIGIFHAALAQLFFVLTCALALFTSKWWQMRARQNSGRMAQLASAPRPMILTATLLILAQLVFGAAMRHQHAGLAIPDFPLAYGKLWPAMDQASIARHNQQRLEITAANDITAAQIGLQMAHRALALVILAAVAACAWQARHRPGTESSVKILCSVWLGLTLIQALLGAATIWSNKAADVATAHVLVGALVLGLGGVLSMITFSQSIFSREPATNEATSPTQPVAQLDLPVPTPVLK
jgi:cytochrome c oxidase assembly protein subunit 15